MSKLAQVTGANKGKRVRGSQRRGGNECTTAHEFILLERPFEFFVA
jgi:hypothetical protein